MLEYEQKAIAINKVALGAPVVLAEAGNRSVAYHFAPDLFGVDGHGLWLVAHNTLYCLGELGQPRRRRDPIAAEMAWRRAVMWADWTVRAAAMRWDQDIAEDDLRHCE